MYAVTVYYNALVLWVHIQYYGKPIVEGFRSVVVIFNFFVLTVAPETCETKRRLK